MKDDNGKGCGISWLWLDAYGDFKPACSIHDAEYGLNDGGVQPKTRKEVDDMFLQIMLNEAKGSTRKKAKAYIYYGLVRALGGLWW